MSTEHTVETLDPPHSQETPDVAEDRTTADSQRLVKDSLEDLRERFLIPWTDAMRASEVAPWASYPDASQHFARMIGLPRVGTGVSADDLRGPASFPFPVSTADLLNPRGPGHAV